MSTEDSPGTEMPPETAAPLETVVQNQGRSLMAVGGLIAILGLGAVIFPIFSSLTVGIFFGIALTVGGVAHIAHAFSAPGWKGALGELILAIVFLVAGIGMLLNPVLALTSLTLLVIAYFVVEGLALLYFAWTLRAEGGWLWSVVAAALTFLLAGLLWVGFPSTAAWALGLLFGVNLLTTGVAMVVVGMGAREPEETAAATATQPRPGA